MYTFNRFIFLCFMLLLATTANAEYTLNMHPGVTNISKGIYELHMLIFWITVGIGIIVFGVMFYAIIFHRKSLGHTAANFHESTLVELIWTIIPLIILAAMAVPAGKLLYKMHDSEDSDLTIKVTGYMWRWHYDYLDHNINFMSNLTTSYEQINGRDVRSENYLLEVDNPMVVPINKKIRILTTANDVIHSWWVPKLGVKKDSLPGFINEAWTKIETPGTYRGQCAELCGARHGFMPIVVEAVTQEEFEEWINKQKPTERTT